MYMWKSHHIPTEKQGEIVCIFSWKYCKKSPCSFFHNHSSGDPVKWEEAATGGGCSKVTFTAGV